MRLSPVSTRRQGVALLMALALMTVLALILAVVTRQIVSQRQVLAQRHRLLQAEWLARAGVELAAARLLENAVGFSDDQQDLLPDSRLHIAVEKSNPDLYVVTAAAEVALSERAPVARTANARFRRTDSGDVIRLQALP